MEGKEMSLARRPFEKYRFTGDYTAFERNMKGYKAFKANSTDPVTKTSCLQGDPLTMYLNNAVVREALHIPSKIQPWSDCSNIAYTELKTGS